MTVQATATTPVTAEKSHRAKLIRKAVRGQKSLKSKGLLEQLFAQMFSGLVYPQIWEDPLVDLLAMEIEPHHHIFTISSGGCNVLSYLTANPSKITAVDLNRAHVALTKTKLKAAESLESWDDFHRLFAVPNVKDNHQLYKLEIEPNLDETTRKHWQGRDITMRKRVRYFSENIYHHGMLGIFSGATISTTKSLPGEIIIINFKITTKLTEPLAQNSCHVAIATRRAGGQCFILSGWDAKAIKRCFVTCEIFDQFFI